jgi:hypothetical protein
MRFLALCFFQIKKEVGGTGKKQAGHQKKIKVARVEAKIPKKAYAARIL